MAISWGSWNNGARLGIEVTVPTPAVGASTVTVSADFYLETSNLTWFTNQNISMNFSGSLWSGVLDRVMSVGTSSTILVWHRTVTVTLTGSVQSKSVANSAEHYGLGYWARTQGPSVSVSIPAKRVKPGTPKISSVTRSGSSITVVWGAVANASGYTLQHRVNGGGWSTVQVAGTSYTRTGAVQGSKYDFRVLAKSSAGDSSYSSVASHSWAPGAPSALKVSRNSDAQHTLGWSNAQTYSSVVVQRSDNDGSWKTVATINSNATSYVDKTTKVNSKYAYRVQGKSAGGTSSASNSVTVFTTPATPSVPSVTRLANDDIRVNTTLSAYATHFDFQDDGVNVTTNTVKAGLPWVHENPNPALTHKYRARASVMSGGESSTRLYSGYSAYSAVVQLQAPPNAPSGLSPNGVLKEDGSVLFVWQHNPVDSSEQTVYELRYRISGAWTVVSGATESSRSVTLSPALYEWQVRTKGAHPSWSDWSNVATIDVVEKPQVAITSPDDPTHLEATVMVEWGYLQAQGKPQSAWRARLLELGEEVESRNGTGATDHVTFAHILTDGTQYTVEVEVATGSIWSAVAGFVFDTDFVPPVAAEIQGVWDDGQGLVELTIHVPTVGEPAVSYTVERSFDEEVWEPVLATQDLDDLFFSDTETISSGNVFYRVTTFSATGAATVAVTQVVADSGKIWVNSGGSFENVFALEYGTANPSMSGGLDRHLYWFAGRHKPVVYAGARSHRALSFSGLIEPSQSVDDVVAVVQDSAPLLMFRDPDGRRVYGSIESVSTSRVNGLGWWQISGEIVEAER